MRAEAKQAQPISAPDAILFFTLLVPTVQFSNLADFYVYLTLILLSKINLYHRFKLWSRSARFSDDLQI